MKCFLNINWNESSGFFCKLLKRSSTTTQETGVTNRILKTVLPLAVMSAVEPVTALAQSNNIPQVQHVIIVVQENRTPTNLFHEDTTLIANGAHVRPANDSGPCGAILQNPVKACAKAASQSIPLAPTPLAAPNYGPNHEHYPDWQCTFDNGAMDGACHATETSGSLPIPCPSGNRQYCPYTYVSDSAIQPYFTSKSPSNTASPTGCFKPTKGRANLRTCFCSPEPLHRITSPTTTPTPILGIG